MDTIYVVNTSDDNNIAAFLNRKAAERCAKAYCAQSLEEGLEIEVDRQDHITMYSVVDLNSHRTVYADVQQFTTNWDPINGKMGNSRRKR